jgi:alanine or glycine:cation symporter, AGCS family
MGSTPHSHAVADVSHPAEQGFVAMIGVFISTFLICLSTVMVNIASGAYNPNISAAEMTKGATVMTQNGFASQFGSFGGMFLSICLSFFALTTIVGWYFFAEANVKFVFNSKPATVNTFKAIAITALVVGTMIDATFAWQLADLFMGLMALPNIIALFFLSKDVKEILADYDSCVEKGNIYWEYEYQDIEEEKTRKGSILRRGLSTTTLK